MRRPDSVVLREVQPPGLPEDVDFSLLTFAPILAAPLGAGSSGNAEMEVEGHLALPTEWLEDEVQIRPARAFVARILGDSMKELLHDGDMVLGERMDTLDRDGIMAFVLGDGTYVKHLQRRPGAAPLVISENPVYDPFPLPQEEPFRLLGRIVRRLTRV